MLKSKVEFKQLEMLHKASVVVLVLLAILSAWLIKNGSFSLMTNYLSKDELASSTTTVLAPAARSVLDVNLRYILPVVLLIGAGLHSITIMKWRKSYEKALKSRMSAPRWLDLMLVVGTLAWMVGVVSGVRDIFELKFMWLSMAVGCVLCYLAEKAAKDKGSPRVLFWTAVVAKALPWLVILGSIIGTSVYGMERLSWYVYAAAATLLLASLAGALNLAWSLKQRGAWTNYLFVERNYLAINITSVSLISVFLIVGLR